jgi:hypothetical protein
VLIHVVRNISGTHADKSETRSFFPQVRDFSFNLIYKIINALFINSTTLRSHQETVRDLFPYPGTWDGLTSFGEGRQTDQRDSDAYIPGRKQELMYEHQTV